MTHRVEIIYPGDRSFQFNYFSNGDMDLFFRMVTDEWKHKTGRECKMFIDAKVRSFSNNDFIKVDDTYYRSTPYGMKEVPEDLFNEIDNKIRNHPYCKERKDPFWAKLEVMDEYPCENFLTASV